MNIDVNYFDPSTMRPGAVVLIIGRRGSGKSTVGADILSFQRDCQRGVCVSATEKENPFWSRYIPRCFIYDEYSDDVTKKLFNMQKKCKREKGTCDKAFAIYDDCMFDKNFMKSKWTRRLFMNGRHSNIFTIITTQYIMDVPPAMRANVDYTICLRDNIFANRERIWRYFAGMFSSFKAFDKTMMECTNDREAMVIDQGSLSPNISDAVFFYKGTPDLVFRVGAPEYWRFSEQQALEDGSSDSEEEDDEVKKKREEELRYKVRKNYPGSIKMSRVPLGGYGKRYKTALGKV